LLKKELNVEASIVDGKVGEFSVWVGDKRVAQKGWLTFPNDRKVMEAVRDSL
jgi:hypothetical protein